MDWRPRAAEFQEADIYCDVTLVAEGKKFRAHRLVLGAASDYFHAMFSGNFKEKTQDEVTLKDVSSKALHNLLQFIYKGKMTVDVKTAVETLDLAELAQCLPFKDKCIDFMVENVDTESCVEFLLAAEKYDSEKLSGVALKYVADNMSVVRGQPAFQQIKKTLLINILKNGVMEGHCSDLEMYQVAVAWLETNPGQWTSPMELLKYVDLTLMTNMEMAETLQSELVKSHADLSYHLLAEQTARITQGPGYFAILMGLSSDLQSLHLLFSPYKKKAIERKIIIPNNVSFSKNPVVVAEDGVLYVMGGHDENNKAASRVMSYNRKSKQWKQLASMLKAGYEKAVFCLNGCIYTVGGADDEKCFGDVECYSIVEDTWIKKNAVTSDHHGSAACVLNGTAYLSGGGSSDATLNTIKAYKESNDTWQLKTTMSEGKMWHQIFPHKDKIYIVGGRTGQPDNLELSTVVDQYDPSSNQCTIVSTGVQLPGTASALAFHAGQLYTLHTYTGSIYNSDIEGKEKVSKSNRCCATDCEQLFLVA